MRRYLALWYELLRISWRRAPAATAAMIGVCALTIAAAAGIALSLRAVIDASAHGTLGTAVAAACVAAVCYGVTVTLQQTTWDLFQLLLDKTNGELRPQIHGWIAGIEGLDHMERTDFLDRLEGARDHSWQICMSPWQLVMAVRSGLQLGLMLLILGAVSPWLLFLLLFAAVPLWFDHRGKQAVLDAETATAEAFRLQRHLFQLGTRADSGKDIRVAGAGEELVRRQAAAWDEVAHLRYRARMRAAGSKFGGWAVFACGYVGTLALVAYQAAHGRGTAGDVVMAVTVASGLRQTVQQVVGRTESTLATRTAIESYFWLRAYAAAETARTVGTIPAPSRLDQGIAFEHVSYSYPGTDRLALDDVSVRIPAGTVVAIVGEYGSGKTTLVKLLAKFYRPDEGRITVDGTDLADLDTADWRSHISAAFQDFGRLETTFAEGVGLGDLPHLTDHERIARAVREADATDIVKCLPQGMDTQLGRELGGVDLSEGQWQRVALARAVMRGEPLLFVLDEPTASLDAPSEHAIFERQMGRARQLAKSTGAVTVIVSHRFSTVTGADLILVLDRGRLVESGTHAELSALNGGRYADLYGIQAAAYST
ncbi:ABC-type multidrug transport system fused ATPase/permease subunit [Kitasatospora sp. MAA19]|uniref:ABC transporter ATP-binding protein n=1 Tax=unclassified Kitasatospora TaxID=2633591 RepID=UPI0024732FF8|nr:ABC transporter ATP-binding protein [Kitasatospora sp. MAA19]MDH6709076.1 ABC-type multidrug transport system fused ATPase/permease subunit [Kitasatospora sp. MAA19]